MFRAETQEIIQRLAAVDQTQEYTLNRELIAKAFADHLTALKQPMRPIRWIMGCKEGVFAAWGAARDAAWDAARDAAWDAARVAARDAAWDAAWDAARGAARDAARGAAVVESVPRNHPRYAEFRAIWMPFVSAFEAGLFIYWITPKEIIAVPRPIFRFRQNRVHADREPAICYPNGECYFFWNGVRMDAWMIETPAESLDVKKVLEIRNVEQRTACIQKIGVERLIQKIGAKMLDTWQDYSLLEVSLNDRPCRYLKMKNPSVGIWHVEGVPNECQTVAEALHSRKPEALAKLPIDEERGEDWFQQGDVCVWPKNATSVKRYPTVQT